MPRSCHCTPAWATERESVSKEVTRLGLAEVEVENEELLLTGYRVSEMMKGWK